MSLPEPLVNERVRLTGIIAREVEAVLPLGTEANTARLTRSLIATVHGHCSFALGGSFALMDETNPLALAQERVAEAVRAHRTKL